MGIQIKGSNQILVPHPLNFDNLGGVKAPSLSDRKSVNID